MTTETGWEALDRAEREALGLAPPRPVGADSAGPGYRPAEWRRRIPSEDLAGLALSGGGIRSATFNLGLLQKLRQHDLLQHFHYLSTVSGGGYVGGFWTAWMARHPTRKGEFPGAGPTTESPEPREIRHLREFSNFLRPRLKLLSFETGRIVATLAGGILPCVVAALAVVLLSLLLWQTLHYVLTAEALGPWLLDNGLGPGIALAALTLVAQALLEALWRRREEEPAARAAGAYWFWAGVASILTGLSWMLLWQTALPHWLLLSPLAPQRVGMAAAAALAPAVAWVAAVGVLVLLRSVLSLRAFWPRARLRQGALDRALARTFLCATIWAVVGVVWLVGQLLAHGGVDSVLAAAGVSGASGGAFVWMRRFLAEQTNKPTGGKLVARAGPWLFQALAYVTLAAVAAAAAALLVVLYDAFGPSGLRGAWIAAASAVILGLLFNPHEVGLHGFYRDRLVRAYLGASNEPAPQRATIVCSQDDLALDECLPERPLHLVCCAANDLAGDPLGTLHRGADSAVLSRLGFQVGSRWSSWQPRQGGHRPKVPTLGDAMTASAAAFNSHMGKVSMRLGQAATFLLTALGLRLGLWIENPERGQPGRRRPWGWLFFRELLGASRVDGRWIHLSDAAHFENLALYELVRRHCRFILLSDCGADPDLGFDDFGNVVRRVREDFGVEIKIDVKPLRPGPDGSARQPMVAGDILYPPSEPGATPDVGILLYVKPTLTGKEPPDVTQYARRNDRFPHETTLDQFYDEAQWESYRRLGEYAAEQALAAIEAADRKPANDEKLARVFVTARYHWLSVPKAEPLLRELDHDWVRLEKRLGKKEMEPLRRQLLRPEAAPPPGERESGEDSDESGKDSREFLAAALPAVREAIRIMEAVFLRTDFGRDDRSPSHRLYMGWLNRFGAWSSTSAFRYWWPWIEPFLSRDFIRFAHLAFPELEHQSFGRIARCHAGKQAGQDEERQEGREPTRVRSKSRCEIRPLTGKEPGNYARWRWDARRKNAAHRPPDRDSVSQEEENRKLLGFFLRPAGDDGPDLNVGVVEVFPKTKDGATIQWNDRDFYIAEGLWGLGIGEAFLDELLLMLRQTWHEARVYIEGEPSAYVNSLYSGAGFHRDPESDHPACFVRDLTDLLQAPDRGGAEPGPRPIDRE